MLTFVKQQANIKPIRVCCIQENDGSTSARVPKYQQCTLTALLRIFSYMQMVTCFWYLRVAEDVVQLRVGVQEGLHLFCGHMVVMRD